MNSRCRRHRLRGLRREPLSHLEHRTLHDNAVCDFELEQHIRLIVLEVLYTKRRMEQESPGIFIVDLEKLTGRPREHLEFTTWYLIQKKLLKRSDSFRSWRFLGL